MLSNIDIKEPWLRRFARLAAPLLQSTASHGLGPRAARNRPGPGLEFLDLRDYQPGDDIRHIDWRQTAQRQQAVVRRFRDEAASDWFVCLDCSASVGLRPDKWSMAARLATAFAYTCLFAGNRVAMIVFSDRIKGMCHLGRGAQQFAAIVDLLRQQDPTEVAPQAASKSNLGLCRDWLTQGSNVFVISDFLMPDGMRADLQAIQARVSSTSALQVLASDEMQVAARGMAQLQDIETMNEVRLVISEQTLDRARRALDAHRAALRTDCARLGIRFTSCDADADWQQVLLEHLKTRL